ncbi:MAG: efflux RND transporter periplasmic adaptor subunit [Candidatus Taylorbacteria bacterium]|nr:efflux RND transporter periplasmic adaptor subunit [Candidatus Taylorbacteria bacterium]
MQTAKNELELTKAPATEEALAEALADIGSAEANVKNAQALLLKTYILSPMTGIVTKQEAKIGEIAGANQTLVSVMSGNFKVEAFVPEVDVAKMAVGNSAAITLDAYGSDIIFPARVVKIDPAETVIDGVSTYKTILEFDKDDVRVRSGLTANTTIESARRENALAIPQRAVYEKGGRKFVRVTRGANRSEERPVETGIRGSNGDVEIVSGLRQGEFVVTASKVK